MSNTDCNLQFQVIWNSQKTKKFEPSKMKATQFDHYEILNKKGEKKEESNHSKPLPSF